MSDPTEPGWKWFPNARLSWSLDVVTLLAVMGESSLAEHSQTITASIVCLLPRIIPAPQALLKPSRPGRLPETAAKMTGVFSGTTLDSVGFFANIITPLDSLPPFSFRVWKIEHTDPNQVGDVEVPRSPITPDSGGWIQRTRQLAGSTRRIITGSQEDVVAPKKESRLRRPPSDEENGLACASGSSTPQVRAATVRFTDDDMEMTPRPLVRRPTARERVQDMLANPTLATKEERPTVPAKLYSPVHILSVFSCILSVAIIVAAGIWHDGAAILAISLVSVASSVVGYASRWHPILMNRKHTNEVPKGDVMIRTREGAFVLIQCTEEVARELYSGTEECEYQVGGRAYRLLMAFGTTLLMLSVVLLGNCTWNSQIFIGGSYIVLNGLYWGLGMIPKSYFWDLSRYKWTDVTPEDAKNADIITNPSDQREGHPSFTRTLWFAIRETKRTGWVGRSGAAPGTDQWKKWLAEAEKNARNKNRAWPSVKRKDDIMKENLKDGDTIDGALQHAPATEVQPTGNNNPVSHGSL